jgi:glycosidase
MKARFAISAAMVVPVAIAACGSDQVRAPPNETPPDASIFDPGPGGPGGGYGSGSGGGGTPHDAAVPPPPVCPTADEQCPESFSYPFNNETSVALCGNYSPTAWTNCAPMTHAGSSWTVTVPVPFGQPVQYKFKVNGTQYVIDPNNPNTIKDSSGNTISLQAAVTCAMPTCAAPAVLPPGVFDWRDAVIYFVFVDRFNIGTSANPACSVSGASVGQNPATSANYLGGNWVGVTDKINSGYFNTLGVNTLWITVPVQNADTLLGAGVGGTCSGTSCSPTAEQYTAYHGYWPTDPTKLEPCFGTAGELTALVAAAHKNNLKVLFDYAMVDIHTSSTVYQNNPSWFTNFCQCGAPSCSDYNDYKCWFAPYLAHFDFTNSSAARTYSVNAALGLVQGYGNDAFRLDAIKQVDPSWLASLRPQITAYESQVADAGAAQHFYMVGETYDFDDMAYIRSFINPQTQLDGQFDFPLRYRLVQAMLLRDTGPMLDYPIADGNSWTYTQPAGMTGLQQFMDFDDSFYPVDAVMSTFVGNQDLPRSIHYAEQTIPSWLGSSAQAALTTNGSGNAFANEPSLETDPNTYERLANAFAVLFTTKGAPLIYYGDEIGLPGGGDPDNRRMMQWTGLSTSQQGLHDRLAALGQIRAQHAALRRGTRTTLSSDQDLWVFETATPPGDPSPDTAYVGINRSDADRTSTMIPTGLTELLTSTASSATVTIPARQTRIWSQPAGDAGP